MNPEFTRRQRAKVKDKVKTTNRPHDGGYKTIFSSPEPVRELIIGFCPDTWLQDIDFATRSFAGDGNAVQATEYTGGLVKKLKSAVHDIQRTFRDYLADQQANAKNKLPLGAEQD